MKRYMFIVVALICAYPASLLAALSSAEDVRIAKDGPQTVVVEKTVTKSSTATPASSQIDSKELEAIKVRLAALEKKEAKSEKELKNMVEKCVSAQTKEIGKAVGKDMNTLFDAKTVEIGKITAAQNTKIDAAVANAKASAEASQRSAASSAASAKAASASADTVDGMWKKLMWTMVAVFGAWVMLIIIGTSTYKRK